MKTITSICLFNIVALSFFQVANSAPKPSKKSALRTSPKSAQTTKRKVTYGENTSIKIEPVLLEKIHREPTDIEREEELFTESIEWKSILGRNKVVPIQVYFIPREYALKAIEIKDSIRQKKATQTLLAFKNFHKQEDAERSLIALSNAPGKESSPSEALQISTETPSEVPHTLKPEELTNETYELLYCHETLGNLSPFHTPIKQALVEESACLDLKDIYCARAVGMIRGCILPKALTKQTINV